MVCPSAWSYVWNIQIFCLTELGFALDSIEKFFCVAASMLERYFFCTGHLIPVFYDCFLSLKLAVRFTIPILWKEERHWHAFFFCQYLEGIITSSVVFREIYASTTWCYFISQSFIWLEQYAINRFPNFWFCLCHNPFNFWRISHRVSLSNMWSIYHLIF